MSKVSIKITSKNQTETFELRKGLGFQALDAICKTPIEYDCRASDCGICIFRVTDGFENLSEPGPAEKDFLKAMGAGNDERLACQCRVLGDVTVSIDDADP